MPVYSRPWGLTERFPISSVTTSGYSVESYRYLRLLWLHDQPLLAFTTHFQIMKTWLLLWHDVSHSPSEALCFCFGCFNGRWLVKSRDDYHTMVKLGPCFSKLNFPELKVLSYLGPDEGPCLSLLWIPKMSTASEFDTADYQAGCLSPAPHRMIPTDREALGGMKWHLQVCGYFPCILASTEIKQN